MIQYLKKYILFSAVIVVLLFFISSFEQFKPVMQFAWLCFILFFILGIATYYFSIKSIGGRFANFMNVFFAGIILKLIITGIVVLIYKSQNENTQSLQFIIPFAVIYFSFLFFETRELVILSNSNK